MLLRRFYNVTPDEYLHELPAWAADLYLEALPAEHSEHATASEQLAEESTGGWMNVPT